MNYRIPSIVGVLFVLTTLVSADFWGAVTHPGRTEDKIVRKIEGGVSSGVQSVGQSFDSNALLFKAVDKGKPKEVRRLLDPSQKIKSATGALEKVAAPIAADPNALFTYDAIAGYEYGTTPLMVAAYRNFSSIAKILLTYGADVNNKKAAKSNYHNIIRYTPLMVAAYHGHPAVVKVLLAHDADKNLVTNTSVVSGSKGTCSASGTIGDGLGHCRSGVTARQLAQGELDKLMKHPKKNRKRIKDYQQVVLLLKKA